MKLTQEEEKERLEKLVDLKNKYYLAKREGYISLLDNYKNEIEKLENLPSISRGE